VIAYIPGTVTHMHHLTYSERNAVIWYSDHRVSEKFVFTDSRIGTAPIMLNCFNFTGISGEVKLFPEQEQHLRDIYYEGDAEAVAKALTYYNMASYILLSQEMMSFGVATLNDYYKALPQEQLEMYKASSSFGEIYDNEGAWLFFLQ